MKIKNLLWGGGSGERRLGLGSRFQCLAEDNVRSIVKTRKFAFTLAEVLITLVVIGIVAAITIPILNNKYQDHTYKSALKKNVTVFQQALNNYYVDKSAYFIEGSEENMLSNTDSFLSYMKAEKLDSDEGVIGAVKGSNIKLPDGSILPEAIFDAGNHSDSYRLSDGTDFILIFEVWNTGSVQGSVMIVYMDLNGVNKGPNTITKDIAGVYFMNNKIFFGDETYGSLPYSVFQDTYKKLYE